MPPKGMNNKKWDAVQDELMEVMYETFPDAEATLEFKIEVFQEVLDRVRLAQREPVAGISSGFFHPNGFVTEELKQESRYNLGFERRPLPSIEFEDDDLDCSFLD